jgi:hypothetical protein
MKGQTMAQALRDEAGKFRKLQDSDYVVSWWLERDRANISLSTPGGRVVFELWDEDFTAAVEDGYLQCPGARASDSAWHSAAIDYARAFNLI